MLYHHRPHGITAQELARRVDVNPRTIYRDINAIRDEFEIAVFDDGAGRMWCEQSDFLPPLKVTLLEAVTLFLSARLMSRFPISATRTSRVRSPSSRACCPALSRRTSTR